MADRSNSRRLCSPPPAGDPAPRDLARLWPRSAWPAVDFVDTGADLPASAFHLRPGEFVTDVAFYLRRLRHDLAAGPDGACAASALRDAFRLRELFGRSQPIVNAR